MFTSPKNLFVRRLFREYAYVCMFFCVWSYNSGLHWPIFSKNGRYNLRRKHFIINFLQKLEKRYGYFSRNKITNLYRSTLAKNLFYISCNILWRSKTTKTFLININPLLKKNGFIYFLIFLVTSCFKKGIDGSFLNLHQ